MIKITYAFGCDLCGTTVDTQQFTYKHTDPIPETPEAHILCDYCSHKMAIHNAEVEHMKRTEAESMTCHACNTQVTPLLTQAGPHTKATCPHCKKYIKFIKQ